LLTPTGVIFGISGSVEGGFDRAPQGGSWAAIWHDTPESRVFLHPGGPYLFSAIAAVSNVDQVGTATTQDSTSGFTYPHAALWHGTAASFTNLEPLGDIESRATATDGTHQYGWVHDADGIHAVMWSGSAASMVSLHPGAPYVSSEILGASSELQAGNLTSPPNWPNDHAAAWRGTSSSVIDLNPAGAADSQAYGACDTGAVGYVNFGGHGEVPAAWLGPDLTYQALPLPAGYINGYATSVEFFNGQYYIGGYLNHGILTNNEAFLWVGVPAPPSAVALLTMAGVLAARRRRARV
jgi:hypothetical protein